MWGFYRGPSGSGEDQRWVWGVYSVSLKIEGLSSGYRKFLKPPSLSPLQGYLLPDSFWGSSQKSLGTRRGEHPPLGDARGKSWSFSDNS